MLHFCETKPYLKRCTVCFGYRRNTVAHRNDTASFSCIPSNFSCTFCLWTQPCASTNSLIFSALAVQITIPKQKEIPGQFYPSSNGLNISPTQLFLSSAERTVICLKLFWHKVFVYLRENVPEDRVKSQKCGTCLKN